MRHEFPRNPLADEALTINRVGPNVGFIVFRGSKAAERGVFTSGPDYSNDGWSGTMAVIDGVERPVNVYDMGIVCSPRGIWPEDTYAIEDTGAVQI